MSSPPSSRFSGNQFAGVRGAASRSSSSSSSNESTMAGPSNRQYLERNTGVAPTAMMTPARLHAPMAPARLTVPGATPVTLTGAFLTVTARMDAALSLSAPAGPGTDNSSSTPPSSLHQLIAGIDDTITPLAGGESPINPAIVPPIPWQQVRQEMPSINLEGLPEDVIAHINGLEEQVRIWKQEVAASEARRISVIRALQQTRDEEAIRNRRYKLVKRKVPKRDTLAVNVTTNRVEKTAEVTAASSRPKRTCRSAYRRG
ncbi:hypothetical protein MMC14_004332 [Varicellaria rhodocarpa]|nr:hypothetical protein [Varicellaria rhodocarpa]